MQGGFGNPARARNRGRRPPEMKQRKAPEPLRQLRAKFEGLGIAVGQLAAVRLVDGPWRHADIVRRGHVVPPEQVGAGERRVAPLCRLPELFAANETAGLPPEPDLHQVAEQPAVSHDAMIARQAARHEGRLHGAGHRRRHCRERAHRAAAGERAEPWRVWAEKIRCETHHKQHERRMHARFRFESRRRAALPRGIDGSGFHVQTKVASTQGRRRGQAMHVMATRAPTVKTLLKLGRVSNLPTVWTNVLAGTALVTDTVQGWHTGVVVLAMSVMYVGGMYLNDYFDRAIDARERPRRPIPAGEISAATVCAFGFGTLALGIVLLGASGLLAAAAGALLALAIVLYDSFHKGNPAAPMIMGLCRALVYCGAAAAATTALPTAIVPAACALLAYVAGLTYAAQQESFDRVGNLWPLLLLIAPMVLALPALANGVVGALVYLALIGCAAYAVYLLAARPMPGAVPRAVALLIAGISLVDAALLGAAGHALPALAAMMGFPITLLLQRYIPGT